MDAIDSPDVDEFGKMCGIRDGKPISWYTLVGSIDAGRTLG